MRMEPSARGYSVLVASLLIVLLLIAPAAWASPKPLDAATVQARIEKRGVNRWICVDENNGVELVGRIIAIHVESFTLQLPNDPDPLEVTYASVVALRTGMPRGAKIFMISAIAGSAAFAIWAAVHFHDVEQSHQLPTAPTLPPIPLIAR